MWTMTPSYHIRSTRRIRVEFHSFVESQSGSRLFCKWKTCSRYNVIISSCRVRSALLRWNKLNSSSEISTDSSITVAVSPASSAFKLWSLSLCLGLYVQIFSQTFLAGPQLGSCQCQPLCHQHVESDRVQMMRQLWWQHFNPPQCDNNTLHNTRGHDQQRMINKIL